MNIEFTDKRCGGLFLLVFIFFLKKTGKLFAIWVNFLCIFLAKNNVVYFSVKKIKLFHRQQLLHASFIQIAKTSNNQPNNSYNSSELHKTKTVTYGKDIN